MAQQTDTVGGSGYKKSKLKRDDIKGKAGVAMPYIPPSNPDNPNYVPAIYTPPKPPKGIGQSILDVLMGASGMDENIQPGQAGVRGAVPPPAGGGHNAAPSLAAIETGGGTGGSLLGGGISGTVGSTPDEGPVYVPPGLSPSQLSELIGGLTGQPAVPPPSYPTTTLPGAISGTTGYSPELAGPVYVPPGLSPSQLSGIVSDLSPGSSSPPSATLEGGIGGGSGASGQGGTFTDKNGNTYTGVTPTGYGSMGYDADGRQVAIFPDGTVTVIGFNPLQIFAPSQTHPYPVAQPVADLAAEEGAGGSLGSSYGGYGSHYGGGGGGGGGYSGVSNQALKDYLDRVNWMID